MSAQYICHCYYSRNSTAVVAVAIAENLWRSPRISTWTLPLCRRRRRKISHAPTASVGDNDRDTNRRPMRQQQQPTTMAAAAIGPASGGSSGKNGALWTIACMYMYIVGRFRGSIKTNIYLSLCSILISPLSRLLLCECKHDSALSRAHKHSNSSPNC